MKFLVALCIVSLIPLPSTTQSLQLPPGCGGNWNTQPIYTDAPKFVREVKNAKLYVLDKVTPPISVLHLWGTPYEMGYATGQIFKKELTEFLPSALQYMVNVAAGYLVKYLHLPESLARQIAYRALLIGLEFTYESTKPYTPSHFMDELKGISAGSGIDEHLLINLNMIPELIKAACTMMGSWGRAISLTGPGNTLFQLRALDWQTDGPFNDYPTVFVYHPDTKSTPGAVPFSTFGWPGFVGAVTGFSSSAVGVSEKFWDHSDYNGTQSIRGYPFHYLLRDILEFDRNTNAALARISGAYRTCSIFIGLGDSATNQFRVVKYGHDHANAYSDTTYPAYPNHPNFENVAYVDSHAQPSGNPCLASQIKENYGLLDVPHIINITAVQKTATTHAAIYDFARQHIYVVSASSPRTGPVVEASQRPYCRLDMSAMWAESRPTAHISEHYEVPEK